MDRIAEMVKSLTRPDMMEQHQRLAEERRSAWREQNQRYAAEHGTPKRSGDARNKVDRYPDMVLREQHLGESCQRCGGTDRLEVCHIIPVETGRDDSPENIMWLCHTCHVLLHDIQVDHTMETLW